MVWGGGGIGYSLRITKSERRVNLERFQEGWGRGGGEMRRVERL